MATRKRKPVKPSRRSFTREFKQQAVQMLLDGYSASSVSDNLEQLTFLRSRVPAV